PEGGCTLGSMTPFDIVVFIALFAMFIVGFAQGITRRLLGIAAILFSLGLAGQLRNALGGYLAEQWTNLPAAYGLMVGFGAVFVAAAVTLSFGIQISYRPAPLLYRYPVLDEATGGCGRRPRPRLRAPCSVRIWSATTAPGGSSTSRPTSAPRTRPPTRGSDAPPATA